MRAELPLPTGQAANRRIIKGALVLVAMLAIPVVGLMLLQAGVLLACSTETVAEGVAEGRIEWRITRMQCRNGAEPFYDVALGAEDKTLSTALTSRGAPVPTGVIRVDEGLVGIRLDRPRVGTAEDVVVVRLRRSGSPQQRIDLQADMPRANNRGAGS
ncbi:MAG TPA: hypothetical protein PLQ11_08365 [Beijerinckiaceae bacterium]|nr:hypothetical protein [Beijerinckiaceae bacterium]